MKLVRRTCWYVERTLAWAPWIKNAEDSSSESRSAESSKITRNNRTALNLSPLKPARSLQKKYGDAFENDFRARLGVLKKIHSRFTRVESIQPGFQVLSNGHESIQRTRFNGFKFNRRRPLWPVGAFAWERYRTRALVTVGRGHVTSGTQSSYRHSK